ncbi:MFS transporter [uncultured Paraglaciecola sp.]|uniref:MFS transporter n=1 Tax=uncultured Paraglaciecola sp. TaxID=1765024 RepID=UPI0026096F41|nr:MFS transporter [uncultured Paraglaciecola sp.]
MQKTLISLTSLFISCFILFLGNGLINVLLPVRMGLDGVNIDTIGIVLSLYYAGMLIGAIYGKNLIKRAGHIRMFSSCVALGAVSILLCSLYSNPIMWGAMRVVIGFCNACALTAIESWLSDSSSKNNRGKILATYNAVVLAGLFGGQFLINIADPINTSLFVIAGILLCAATIPIGLSTKKGPKIELVDPMPLARLYHISPLGVFSCLIAGVVYSALFNLLPVFAHDFNIVGLQMSWYLGAGIFGALVLQFPVGYLSDCFDRRKVLLVLLVISASAGLINIIFAQLGFSFPMFVATAISCGIVACIYPLSIAEAFDRLRQSEMVAAMGSMIIAFSVGGVLGPILASIAMTYFGAAGLFYFLALVQCVLAVFVIYRMRVRQALPIDQQEHFVMQNSAAPPSVELDPRSEYAEQVQTISAEGKTAKAIAKVDPVAAVNMVKAISIVKPSLAIDVAATIAKVRNIDLIQLMDTLMQSLPYEASKSTKALVTARPEFAFELIMRLGKFYPEHVVTVAEEIGQALPELRVITTKAVMEVMPESALEMAEYYAHLLSEEHEAIRPAERDDDRTEEHAVNISAELWQGLAEQAIEVAVAMADAIPESAATLAQEYIASNAGVTSDLVQESNTPSRKVNADIVETEQVHDESEFESTVELVSRIADVAPKQALDMAVAVVNVLPDSAADVATAMAAKLSGLEATNETGSVNSGIQVFTQNETETQTEDNMEHQQAVELVNRLADASPDNALDVAVAVVEVLPESASKVVDAMSEGDESVDEEWMTAMSDKPKVFE